MIFDFRRRTPPPSTRPRHLPLHLSDFQEIPWLFLPERRKKMKWGAVRRKKGTHSIYSFFVKWGVVKETWGATSSALLISQAVHLLHLSFTCPHDFFVKFAVHFCFQFLND